MPWHIISRVFQAADSMCHLLKQASRLQCNDPTQGKRVDRKTLFFHVQGPERFIFHKLNIENVKHANVIFMLNVTQIQKKCHLFSSSCIPP